MADQNHLSHLGRPLGSALRMFAARPYETRADLDELREDVIRRVLIVLPVGTVILGLTLAGDLARRLPIATMVLLPVPILLWWIGSTLLNHSSVASARFVVLASFTCLSGTIWLFPHSAAAALLPVVVLMAAAMLGTFAGVLAAVGATAVASIGLLAAHSVVEIDVAIVTILTAWAAAGFSWLTAQPLHTALQWSWHSYELARQTADELRDQRAELVRTVKSLGEAYDHLTRLNEELARARLAAEEARRVKAEFAANISHELRTPLNLIVGFSEVMMLAPAAYGSRPLPAAYRRDVDAIHRNAQHLSNLINDVLDLSQVEIGQVGLSKEVVSISEIADEAAGMVARAYRARGLDLYLDVPESLPKVYVDRCRIRQVFINLLSNGARFTERGGVSVRGHANERELIVEISDTGAGIPSQDLDRVFEAFHRLDATASRGDGGSGLGLAICKRFVELHGGNIWATSKLGQGSTFHFSLPLARSIQAAPLPAGWRATLKPCAPAQPEKPTVLIACEDAEVVQLFRQRLDGWNVTWSPHLDLTPAATSSRTIGAVLRVVTSGEEFPSGVPGVNGISGGREVPVVVCCLPRRQRPLIVPPAVACLAKPVSRDQVLRQLGEIGPDLRDVLVVDDDPEMVRLLAQMVSSAGRRYRTRIASSGVEAMALMRKRRPDAIFLDLLMPDLDGSRVLDEMRADPLLRQVPVVVVTAAADRGGLYGTDLVALRKPSGLTLEEMLGYVRYSLDILLKRQPAGSDEALPAGTAG